MLSLSLGDESTLIKGKLQQTTWTLRCADREAKRHHVITSQRTKI